MALSELDAASPIIELRQHIYHAWRAISPTSDTLSATLPLTFTQGVEISQQATLFDSISSLN
jgi:hypothetical protein